MKLKKSGFTLLEILITLIILTLGVVVLAGLFSNGLVGSTDAENTTIAMNLAQRRMEEIRNLGFPNIEDEPKDDVSGFSGFQREVAVTDPPGDPTTDDLKKVTVTVYWTYKADEVDVSLATYISKD
jgi:prepilin-type N-terminal cleavage/methylation domain-containing protein